MAPKKKHLLEIHVAVLLFGFSGLFAKLLHLPAPLLVLGRTIFAAAVLAACIYFSQHVFKLTAKKDYLIFIALGALLAVHWVTFFYSIQVSSVAIGLLSTATFPIFAAFIEPIVFRERLQIKDIAIALIAFFGVYLIVPTTHIGSADALGVLLGLVAGCTFALLAVLNRKCTKRYSSLTIVFYQNLSAAILTLPALFFMGSSIIEPKDIVLLGVLGVLFTAASHMLFVRGIAGVKAQLATVIASLEPVYGILLAVPLLGEIPTTATIVGGSIILLAAFLASNEAIFITSAKLLKTIRIRYQTSRLPRPAARDLE